MNSWIDINEQKPEQNTSYLCVVRMATNDDYFPWHQVLKLFYKEWLDTEDKPLSDWYMVTHWMPLPALPDPRYIEIPIVKPNGKKLTGGDLKAGLTVKIIYDKKLNAFVFQKKK